MTKDIGDRLLILMRLTRIFKMTRNGYNKTMKMMGDMNTRLISPRFLAYMD